MGLISLVQFQVLAPLNVAKLATTVHHSNHITRTACLYSKGLVVVFMPIHNINQAETTRPKNQAEMAHL